VTPTSYLDLISSFRTLLQKARRKIKSQQSRYENGLGALADAAVAVGEMQEMLIDLQPDLKVAQGETAEMLTTVEAEKRDVVEPKKRECEADERAAEGKAQEAGRLKASCEADLAEATPRPRCNPIVTSLQPHVNTI